MANVPYRSDKPTHTRVYKPPVVLPEDRAERKKLYNSKEWRALRLLKLGRDPLCEECLRRNIVEPGAHVHHLQSLAERPDLALSLGNLETLCVPCHSRETSRERNDGRSKA